MAKGMALYIDSLTNNTMAKTMTELAPINVSFMADYPDFFAFTLVMLITGKNIITLFILLYIFLLITSHLVFRNMRMSFMLLMCTFTNLLICKQNYLET